MARVPVPDDYDDEYIGVTVSRENASLVVGGYDRRADIEVDDPNLDRDIRVREDDDGRYVGVHTDLAPTVAAYLRDEYDADLDPEEYARDEEAESGDESDTADTEGDASSDDTDGEDAPTAAEQIDAGVCPWCNDYEGDGVAQHASAAHPEEWADYKED